MNRHEAILNASSNFQRLLGEFPQFRYIGDPVLRTEAKEISVEEGIKTGQILGEVLIKYRKLVGYGRGLAAPQIGLNQKVFVTYLEDQIQTYINPQIISTSKTQNYYRELCLSNGILWCDVKRASTITMDWVDITGKNNSREFDGVLARLLQHEEKHMHGELSIDIAEPGSLEIVIDDPLKEVLRDKPLYLAK